MPHKRASAPWKALYGERTKPRRTRTRTPQPPGPPGCIWPQGKADGTCRKPVQQGLALCPHHAKVLAQEPTGTCAWPGCPQPAPFRSLCTYHHKRALGLLEGGR